MVAATLPKLAPRHWVYLDEHRTHEVHAEVEPREGETLLVTTEFPAGSRESAEAVQSARRVDADAQVRSLLHDLEGRLRLSGSYFRLDVAEMRWTPLGPAPAGARVDLRAIELPLPGGRPGATMGFHHFHNPTGEDRLLITMPRMDVEGDRHVLAELSFQFPQVEAGDLQVRHTRLAPPVLRSSLVKEHVEMPRQGFSKLIEARDYRAAYGDGWVESARSMWRGAASRLLLRRATSPPPPPPAPHGAPTHARLDDVRAALGHARVLGLKGRFLQAHEEARAMAGGEHAIRRLVLAKRRQHDHTSAYDLSMLECALLLEHALARESWSLVDEEADKLVRYVKGNRRA